MSSTPHSIPDKATAEAITAVKFLKLVALDDRTNLYEIGHEQGLDKATVDKILNRYKYLVLADMQTGDYPKRTLGIFNNACEPYLPEQEKLVEDDLERLKFILKFKKGKKKVISETDRTFNDNMSYEPTTRQPYNNMGAPPMVNTGQPGQWGPQPQTPYQPQQGYPGQSFPPSVDPYQQAQGGQQYPAPQGNYIEDDDDVSLMRMLLTNNFNPRPHLINGFLDNFKRFKHSWMQQPQKLLAALKSNFGPQAGETAFMMFMDTRPSQSNDAPGALYQLTGASNYQPMNPALTQFGGGMGQNPWSNFLPGGDPNAMGGNMAYGYGYGQQGMMSRAEVAALEEDKKFNRLIERMIKANTILSMNQMYKANLNGGQGGPGAPPYQNPFGPPQEYHREVDPNTGRVTHEYWAPGGMYGGQQQTQGDPYMLEFMRMMNTQNNTLLTNALGQASGANGGGLLGELVKSIVGSKLERSGDEFDKMSKMMDIMTNMRASMGLGPGGPNDPNSPAAIKLKEIDTDMKLGLAELKMQADARQHEWNLQEAEAHKADENTQMFFKLAKELGSDAIGPLIKMFAEAYITKAMGGGAGQGAGGPGGMLGQIMQNPEAMQNIQRMMQGMQGGGAGMPPGGGGPPGGGLPPGMQDMDPEGQELLASMMGMDPQAIMQAQNPMNTGRMNPAQFEEIKADQRHLEGQLERQMKENERLRAQMQQIQSGGGGGGGQGQFVVQQQGPPPEEFDLPDNQEEQPLLQQQQDFSNPDQSVDRMLSQASDEELDSIVREIEQKSLNQEKIRNKVLAQLARRKQVVANPYTAVSQQQRNNPQYRPQVPKVVDQEELRAQNYAQSPYQAPPPNIKLPEPEPQQGKEVQINEGSAVNLPRNLGKVEAQEDRTGMSSVIGAGGMYDENPYSNPQNEQQEYAQMTGYNAPRMDFGVSVKKDVELPPEGTYVPGTEEESINPPQFTRPPVDEEPEPEIPDESDDGEEEIVHKKELEQQKRKKRTRKN